MVILPDEERQSRVGRKSRRSTRRPHSAAFVLHRVGRLGPKRKKVLRVADSGELDLFSLRNGRRSCGYAR
eukprot:852167-Pleurochrysis_carterae.AAC.1